MSQQAPQTEQAAALRAARKALRMSQGHLAQAACVSDRTVRRAEAGHALTDEVMRALCSVLNLDASNLRPPDGAPPEPRARELMGPEVHIRTFIYDVTKRVGGLHPLTFLIILQWVLNVTWFTSFTLLAGIGMMWLFPRTHGATSAQSFLFMRGHAFADGSPTHVKEMAKAHWERVSAKDRGA